MKVAIAVETDNMQVAKRMGRAPWFAIFQINGDAFTLEKMAENEHAKEHHGASHHHHEEHNENEIEHHRQHLAPLKGVDAILARAIGPNMRDALLREGIAIYRLPKSAGDQAGELLTYFIQHRHELEEHKA